FDFAAISEGDAGGVVAAFAAVLEGNPGAAGETGERRPVARRGARAGSRAALAGVFGAREEAPQGQRDRPGARRVSVDARRAARVAVRAGAEDVGAGVA